MINESLIFFVSGVRQVSDLEVSIHQGFHSQGFHNYTLCLNVCTWIHIE